MQMFIDTVTGYGASVLCLCGLLMKVFETEKDGQRNGEREKEIARPYRERRSMERGRIQQ